MNEHTNVERVNPKYYLYIVIVTFLLTILPINTALALVSSSTLIKEAEIVDDTHIILVPPGYVITGYAMDATYLSSPGYSNPLIVCLDGNPYYSPDYTFSAETSGTKEVTRTNLNSYKISIINPNTGTRKWRYKIYVTLSSDVASESTVQNALNAANSAKSSADSAKTEATAAKNNAAGAKSSADTAASRVWDTTEGKSVTTISKEARDKANQAAGDATYIRNTQLPDLTNKIANLETNITNINNLISSDQTAPTVDWATVSGAYSTSGSSINLIIAATDNSNSNLQYSINGGTYSPLPEDGIVSASVNRSGPNAITVKVKDEADNIGSKTRTIWKLN